METELLILLFIIDLFLLGVLSAAEIAIASFGTNKIEDMQERGDKLSGSFKKIQSNPESFFGTIQVSVTLLQLVAALLTFIFFDQNFSLMIVEQGIESINKLILLIIISVIVSSFFILTAGTLIPKAIGFKYSDSIGRKLVKPLLIISAILNLPVKYITLISNLILFPFKEKTNFSQTRLSEDEIRIILSEGVKSGAIDKTEHEIINNIFEFTDLRANEVMIPRTDMIAIDIEDQDPDSIKEILRTGHSLIPVFKETSDNIIGVFHTKDLIRLSLYELKTIPQNLIRPAYFVPETKLISEILKEMQKRGERLAIVTDEYGGTEGVITLEDILEEIVGKISDNSTSEVSEYIKFTEGKYYVLGSMFIEDFNTVFNINLPESDEYNTVSGFVSFSTGKILNIGEVLEFEGLKFELVKKLRQKMVQFKIYSGTRNFGENIKEE